MGFEQDGNEDGLKRGFGVGEFERQKIVFLGKGIVEQFVTVW